MNIWRFSRGTSSCSMMDRGAAGVARSCLPAPRAGMHLPQLVLSKGSFVALVPSHLGCYHPRELSLWKTGQPEKKRPIATEIRFRQQNKQASGLLMLDKSPVGPMPCPLLTEAPLNTLDSLGPPEREENITNEKTKLY